MDKKDLHSSSPPSTSTYHNYNVVEGEIDIVELLRNSDVIDTVRGIINKDDAVKNSFFTGKYRPWGKGTLLHFACRWGRPRVVEFLLIRGSNGELTFQGGQSYSSGILSYDGYTAEGFVKSKLKSTRRAEFRVILELFGERRRNMPVFKTIEDTVGFPVLGSHRGGRGDFGPENTMHNFYKSLQYKCNAIEIDLQLTKDGHIVLFHDKVLDRITKTFGLLQDFTLSQLRTLNAAASFPSLTGITIPTLDEFLDAFIPHQDLFFFFDFKDLPSAIKTLPLIQDRKIEHRVVVSSNDIVTNLYLKQHKPTSVPIVADLLSSRKVMCRMMNPCHDIIAVTMDSDWMNLMGWVLTAEVVNWIHEEGRRVAVFKVDDEESQLKCLEMGVDFLITDQPDVLDHTWKKRML